MGKYPFHLQMGQGEHVGNGGGVLRRDAQPVHSGVQGQVDLQFHPLGGEGQAVGRVSHRLGQAVGSQQGSLLRRGPPQHQDHPGDPRPAEGDPLGQAGHREGVHSLGLSVRAAHTAPWP